MDYGRVEDGLRTGWRWVEDGLEMDYGLDKKIDMYPKVKILIRNMCLCWLCIYSMPEETEIPEETKEEPR